MKFKKIITILLVFCMSFNCIAQVFAGETYIQCKKCSYKEVLNKGFFLKVIGGSVTGFGFWAWVSFLFAGTGFALPICIAIVSGGTLLCAYSSEIVEWLSKKYSCPSCRSRNWRVIEY